VYTGTSPIVVEQPGIGACRQPHINGVAPYWRLAYQVSKDPYYFSIGTFGLEAKLQPDVTVPDTDRYSDLGFDATYQYANEDQSALTVNASYIRENQKLSATFNAGGVGAPSNHLNT